MTKPASTTKNPRKQHTPEFRHEALKLAERIGVAAAARSGWYIWHQTSSSDKPASTALPCL
ncbi:hypothetical protein JXW80_004454 [Salmonella enterica]|uniref:hypothetical protein n=1 Tax=Salmonella enterica TaxID=28901 RepID=UPI000DA2C08C|nr:hypothetical protein [Salmonella enterica]EEG1558001.1 hypothetical protein [Salmonella enterica subsp. enterica serovar Midway]SQH89685.1 IS3 transposase [Salmonella enterica subsp. enterica] [Salmonella enterica subsp. enterica serovar Florida]EDO5313865.1 hypothetical protein [Salmonella enterica]EDZ3055955.1 hypothetical protein [Salmonella enterica]EDZ3838943.1 hypothetical protein [Salmonella enterica]